MEERLQRSGERDRLKEWLMEALESTSWVEQMFKLAEETTAQEKEKAMTDDDVPCSVEELVQRMMPQAMECVPNTVKTPLLKELVAVARRFAAEGDK